MRKVYHTVCMLAALCVTTSCDDFLDKMPDKRAEINSNQKINELLVSAYPNVDPMMIYEHRTDNVMDNGTPVWRSGAYDCRELFLGRHQ